MYCPNCGKAVEESVHFCANCGKPLIAKDKKEGLFLPAQYIVLVGLSFMMLFNVMFIPYLLLKMYGRTYTMRAFTANQWPGQIRIARDVELICDLILLAILISSAFCILFAFRKQAKFCLFFSTLIVALSGIGFRVVLESLSPIKSAPIGGAPTGFIVSFFIALAMLLISADICSKQKRKKTKLRRLY